MQMHVHRSIMMIMGYLFLVLMLLGNGAIANAQLSTGFYSRSCPHLPHIVKSQVHSALSREARMGASILRLFFHDCFVNGCEASLLLDDTPTMIGEKTAAPNNNSVRGFEVIDSIKSAVERACPRVVSCADILAIAAKDSVHLLGGPNWDVKLGRRDARTASFTAANTNLPPPSFNLTQLIHRFQQFNLSPRDMVALSGAHTIGQAQCVNFRNHIYNGTNIDPSFAAIRQSNCPRPSGSGDANLAPLDLQTPNRFDNAYYQNLVQKKGLLNSDQVLFNNDSTDSIVAGYAANPSSFNNDFVAAMIKMGDISPLTGSNGEIRINCRRVN